MGEDEAARGEVEAAAGAGYVEREQRQQVARVGDRVDARGWRAERAELEARHHVPVRLVERVHLVAVVGVHALPVGQGVHCATSKLPTQCIVQYMGKEWLGS